MIAMGMRYNIVHNGIAGINKKITITAVIAFWLSD
jgi:hypothetical protein